MFFLIRLGVFCIFLLPFVFCRFQHRYPETRVTLNELGETSTSSGDYILPTNLKPTSYDLTLTPFLDNSTFEGKVSIIFDVVTATDQIVIHVNNESIDVSTLEVSLKTHKNISVTNVTSDGVREFLMVNLSSPLPAGENNANLSISYDGKLASDMQGFYLSTYTSNNNTNHSMAITQFESTYARRAFPCFDEPQYRANFTINIIRSKDQNSMSNMPLDINKTLASGMVMDTYMTSPAMPTYLVAFGVSDLAYSETTDKKFGVFARQAAMKDTDYLMSIGPAILNEIGTFVGITYPMHKMGVVAVPDFDAGAMENWGLTTYREKYVLFDPERNTWDNKIGVLAVMSHEFGHQWFGDLVTPAWWDYAWLNEAFATYFEYVTSDKIEPSWNMGSTMYIINAVQYALAVDTGNPRPMTAHAETPDQIDNLFDYVIYEKGGSILRMTENFLTTQVWKAGLNSYLEVYAYKTGTPEKLFSALQTAATSHSIGLNNVNETLQGWTTQPGYPVITVTEVASNTNTTTYNITQAPYALDANISWNVPLRYTTQSQLEFNAINAPLHWHYPADPTTNTLSVDGNGWVIFNIDQVGYYRVNYDNLTWNKLVSQMDSNFTVIGSHNRAKLVDDSMRLAYTGHLDYDIAFRLTSYLTNETTLAPWSAFFTNMRHLINRFYGTSTGNGLQIYAQNIMTTPFRALTANLSDTVSTFMGGMTVLAASEFSCEIRLPDCESQALEIFQSWRKNPLGYMITPEIKKTVMCTGLRLDSSIEAFNDVLTYYYKSDNAAEKLTVIYALGCLSNEAAITKYLDAVCDPASTKFRMQDRWIAIRALVSYQTGITPFLDYITSTSNYTMVSNVVGPRLSSVFSSMASTITQESHFFQVQSIVNNPQVDQKLREMLNSTVLPAWEKYQTWKSSPQAVVLKNWVQANVKSSALPVMVNVLLMLFGTLFVIIN